MTVHSCCLYSQYGNIEEMNVCDNLGDHLVGNVYIKVIASKCPVQDDQACFQDG